MALSPAGNGRAKYDDVSGVTVRVLTQSHRVQLDTNGRVPYRP